MQIPKHTLTFGWIVLVVLVLTACVSPTAVSPTPTPTTATIPTSSPSPLPTQTALPPYDIRLAWFYKPPENIELAQIARLFSIFILTKGDEPERDQLLALGAKHPILQYLRFEVIHDPGDCTRQPWRNQVAYQPGDFCRISQEHPDWFLLDKNGQRIVNPYGNENFVMMDPGSPGWRAFFLERARSSQADAGWDGVFLDNVEVTLAFREQRNELPAAYADEPSYQKAVQGFLEYLYTRYFQPNGKLLFANLVARKDEADWVTYLSHLDGAMHEGWSIDWPDGYRSVRTWEKQMNLAEQTQASGKFIILVSQGKRKDEKLQQFAFTSYLLINHGRAAFRYANSQFYREAWTYENYALELGRPLGQRYLDGDVWKRDFTNGSVMVNPKTHEAEIVVRK